MIWPPLPSLEEHCHWVPVTAPYTIVQSVFDSVTEHPNPATEEHLKTGHCSGEVSSIVCVLVDRNPLWIHIRGRV